MPHENEKTNLPLTKSSSTQAIYKEQNNVVYNQSDRCLSTDEIKLLEKGLKFIPSRDKINMCKILADLREWERLLRLREYYYETDSENDNESLKSSVQEVHNKIDAREKNKIWMPPTGRDPSLDLYIELVKEDVISGINIKKFSNITKNERIALTNLMKDDTIIIRPADKGSGIVVMNRNDYKTKVNQDLATTKHTRDWRKI